MIIVTGSSVTVRILSSIASPHPGFFVSTTTTPSPVTSAAVLPPPPVMTYRLSLTCSISATLPCATGRPMATAKPMAISAARTVIRFMKCLRPFTVGTTLHYTTVRPASR